MSADSQRKDNIQILPLAHISLQQVDGAGDLIAHAAPIMYICIEK